MPTQSHNGFVEVLPVAFALSQELDVLTCHVILLRSLGAHVRTRRHTLDTPWMLEVSAVSIRCLRAGVHCYPRQISLFSGFHDSLFLTLVKRDRWHPQGYWCSNGDDENDVLGEDSVGLRTPTVAWAIPDVVLAFLVYRRRPCPSAKTLLFVTTYSFAWSGSSSEEPHRATELSQEKLQEDFDSRHAFSSRR